jgi:DNA-binding SARP family transcriptional activator
LSHTLYFSGKFEQSQRLCRALLKKALKLNIEPCLPLIYYQLSANSYYLGEYQSGCNYAQKGIESCEKISLADSRKAWVYLAWAQNSLGLENFHDVFSKIDKSTPLFEQPGNRWGLASTWDCLATAYLAQKKTTLAKENLEKGLEMIKGYGLRVTRSILENTYAKALLADHEYQDGLERLLASRPDLKGAAYHLFNNYLLSAQAQFNLGKLHEACGQMARATDLSLMHSYDSFLVKEKIWIIPLLQKACDTAYTFLPGVLPYLDKLFSPESGREPAVLKICLLGKFKLNIGNKVIRLSDWKSNKSLMILKYLAANHGQGHIHRERLIELLWPEQDPQKTAARFNMAMSTLRKTLEPKISPKAPSAYIDRKKDTYRLFDDKRIRIDSEMFSFLLSKALMIQNRNEKSISSCLDAIDLYRGNFLEEDQYDEWCIEKREAFSRDYESALQIVIQIFEQKKNLDQAIFFAETLFKKNPLDEMAVEKLMCFYAQTDSISKVKRIYNTYVQTARQFDFPVSEKLSAYQLDLVKI